MLHFFGNKNYKIKEIRLWQGLLLGSFIGFFSGLIGIGGGIILTPIIIFVSLGKHERSSSSFGTIYMVKLCSRIARAPYLEGLKLI